MTHAHAAAKPVPAAIPTGITTAVPPSGAARVTARVAAANDPRFSTLLRASGAAPRPLDLGVRGAHYTVVGGDSLESIAKRTYGDSSQCDRIRLANKGTFGPRRDVFAGMVLWLPPIHGQAADAARAHPS